MFRLHLWVFIVVNVALNITNAFVRDDYWWAFWPLVVWGIALAVHYLIYKSRRVSDRWVEERTDDLRSRSYDRAHIDSIETRFKDKQ